MRKLRLAYNATKLYFVLSRTRRWCITVKDPIKREISEVMFSSCYPVYCAIKPFWLPTIKPLPIKDMKVSELKSLLVRVEQDAKDKSESTLNV